MKATLDGLIMTDHTLDSIRGYVIQDLAEAMPSTVEDWVELHLGLQASTLERWSSMIARQRWFEDPDILPALEAFCLAKSESERYDPFIKVVTRILQMAQGKFDLHGSRNTFPIKDIGLFNGSDRPIQTIPEHGILGAERKPDILLMRQSAMPAEESDVRVRWVDVLSWFELKYNGSLRVEYNRARTARGLPPLAKKSAKSSGELTTIVEEVRAVFKQ